MICKSCTDGGNANKIGLVEVAVEKHNECEFNDCCCQHKVKATVTEREHHASE
jgi:hypothetical protein